MAAKAMEQLDFNPRSPAGATKPEMESSTDVYLFQSTLPRGSDPLPMPHPLAFG